MITCECYNRKSEQCSLLCETEGWFPDPDLQWLNSKGDIQTAGVSKPHRDAELLSVTRRFTVHKNDIDTFHCRVTLGRHMKKDQIKPAAFFSKLLHTPDKSELVQELSNMSSSLHMFDVFVYLPQMMN